MAKLSYRDARGVLHEHQLGKRTSIGRHPDQAIQILDRVVSKQHAEVVALPDGGFAVQDGGSRNGTYVNGSLIQDGHRLSDGDRITVGSTDMFYHEEREPNTDSFTETRGGRVTIHSDDLQTHIRSKLAHQVQDRFLPESTIRDDATVRRDYEKLRIAHELSQSIGVEMDLEVLLQKILDKAFEIFPADRGVILLRPEESDSLVPMVVKSRQGDDGDVDDVRISQTILNEVCEEKQAVLSSDAMSDSRFSGSHSIILGQIRSTMSVPLLHEKRILGVIHLDSKLASGAFTEKDLQILTGFARQAAAMVQHHRLLKKMEAEIVVREKMRRLLSPQLVEEVVSGRLELKKGGELRHATVMFADIRNFTSVSEQLPPQEVVDNINEYFELMVDVIFKYEGTLDKFIGDEIMAIWGAPIGHPDDAERAVRCVIEMQQVLEQYNAEREAAGEMTFKIGIGLNTGEVVAGYMGSTKSMNYTVMGDVVNTAARFCSAAGPDEILIGEDTFAEVADMVDYELLPPTKLKGKMEHVDIYRILGLKGAGSFEREDTQRTAPPRDEN
ncbi:FHA domain-containing protein [Persicimonas caeni]|uniref:FHA domain-containing protein n=1 Tax=Persicimonas caeni TaxID=2292766 RepID=A0A4Y6PQ29_PERCE|nr:adenylate/guanylate cyclase domain-containing protein [Persicimonas caeni]QDG50107.1 FHA domain-containing protein [Persicimonas caeni]QED31328.1 FHA domain-containing protein [Persicimonas caeni]